ncbi:hypothetical protein D3C87_1036800 [compost metagenome]
MEDFGMLFLWVNELLLKVSCSDFVVGVATCLANHSISAIDMVAVIQSSSGKISCRKDCD